MSKAVQILTNCKNRGQKRAGGLSLNEAIAELKAKDEEIERLKLIVEEAIRKPMGVEPHSWSDYKMLKDSKCTSSS